MSKPVYRRLTRPRSRQAFSVAQYTRSSLWLAEDHLMSAEVTGFQERYRRYYFRDIQALVLQGTRRRLVIAWVLGVFATLGTLVALFVPEEVARWFFGAGAGVFWLMFAYNLAAGPTVVGHIRTAVQAEVLPSLHRLRQAERILARVRPLIVAAQGEVPPAEISPRLEQLMMESGPLSAHPAGAPPPAAAP